MKKKFKSPDLNAPRHREKIKDFLSYPDRDLTGFFCRLKHQHPQLAKYSNREIAGWITEYNKQMAQEVAINRQGVKLPEGLGVVITGTCKLSEKTAGYNIDYKTSRDLGFTVPYRNGHTDGYTAKIYYTNNIPRCRFQNHQIWNFKPVRALSRAVSAIMKTEAGYKRYFTFSAKLPVSYLFNKPRVHKASWRVLKAERDRIKFLEEYNEFEFI